MIRVFTHRALSLVLVSLLAVACPNAATQQSLPSASGQFDGLISSNVNTMIEDGRQIFRYDTFGDEGFWSDALKLHQAIAGAAREASALACRQRQPCQWGSKWTSQPFPKNSSIG